MIATEVEEIVRAQLTGVRGAQDCGTTLEAALVSPRRISVILRRVEKGQVSDEEIQVWLVGQESVDDGYKIVMCDDPSQFGLASGCFSDDRYPILIGWYGSLLTTFLAM
jgi:hypothetical protein